MYGISTPTYVFTSPSYLSSRNSGSIATCAGMTSAATRKREDAVAAGEAQLGEGVAAMELKSSESDGADDRHEHAVEECAAEGEAGEEIACMLERRRGSESARGGNAVASPCGMSDAEIIQSSGMNVSDRAERSSAAWSSNDLAAASPHPPNAACCSERADAMTSAKRTNATAAA